MGFCLFNKMSNFRVLNRTFKRFQLIFFPFRDELNPAIGKIADTTDDFESVRQVFNSISKSNTLHTARIKNM